METGTTTNTDSPFFVTFTVKKQSFKITLNDPQHLLKISSLMAKFLRKNDIDHVIEIKKPKI